MSKSVEELFKDAPEWATHCGIVSSNRICWYFLESDSRYEYAYQNEGREPQRPSTGFGKPSHQPLIERPKPKPWSGPGDGLPPVGMRFTFKGLKHRNHDYLYALKDWCAGDVVSVVAHVSLQGELSALYWNEHKMTSSTVRSDLLEPVKTPEQLAADKRETAISEIMDVADVDCRVTAARLVDAGFKREVV